jgi:uncharacterized protein (TIGR03083 family)
METTTHLSALHREAAALAAAARVDLTAAVRHCPGWDVAELVRHTGRAHRWAATNIAAGTPDKQTKGDDIVFPPDAELASWLEAGAAEVAATISADPDRACWSFAATQRSARFWARRVAQETLVHRWDAELAVGLTPSELDPSTALDGIDEFLTVFIPLVMRRSGVTLPDGSLHLHRTDAAQPGETRSGGDTASTGAAGEWMLRRSDDGSLALTHEHGKGDAAVRASASDLLLLLWGRLDLDAPTVTVFGEHEHALGWLSMAP